MKTQLLKFFPLIFLLSALSPGFAQKPRLTEGKVVYKITFPDMNLDPSMAAMMPNDMTLLIKGDKSRMTMKMGMGMNQVTIYDNKTGKATMLMDMMGTKYAVNMTREDMEKEKGKVPKISVKDLPETKMIAGYKCKKAEVKVENEAAPYYIYYTKDIAATNKGTDNPFKDLDGFLMEYQLRQNQMSMKITAQSVSEEKVEDSNFVIPAGYKNVTKEEFAKIMGGGR